MVLLLFVLTPCIVLLAHAILWIIFVQIFSSSFQFSLWTSFTNANMWFENRLVSVLSCCFSGWRVCDSFDLIVPFWCQNNSLDNFTVKGFSDNLQERGSNFILVGSCFILLLFLAHKMMIQFMNTHDKRACLSKGARLDQVQQIECKEVRATSYEVKRKWL